MSDKTSRLLALFNLPPSAGPPLDSFHCAYVDGGLPYQGTLYLLGGWLAFHSSLVPLRAQKLLIPYADIRSLSPARLLGMDRSLAVRTGHKRYLFTSFLSRDLCLAGIERLRRAEGAARRRAGGKDDDDDGQGEAEGGGGDGDGDGDGYGAGEGDAGDGGNNDDGDAGRTANKRRPNRLGVEDDEHSISFASESDEADDEPTSAGPQPKAAKGRQPSARPNRANHRRALSANYSVGERYAAAQDKAAPTDEDGGGALSRQERLLARNAQRIRQDRERAEKDRVEAAEAELREEQQKERRERERARGDMMARYSPMNLIRTKEEKEEEAARRKRREERQEWEHNTDSDMDAQEAEQEKRGRRGKPLRQPIRLQRKRDGGDDDDGNRAASAPSLSAEEERIDDETSPDYIPPQPSSLYMPRSYTLADPQVTAIAGRFSSLSAPLDTKNRRYVAEGLVQRQGRYSVVSRQMLLFSDKLILAKVRGNGRLQMKQQCDIDTVTLDVRPVEQQWKECRGTRLPDPFRVCFVDNKGAAGCWVLSVSEGGRDRRRQWVRQIQLAVSRVLWVRWKEQGRQFEWGWYMLLVNGSIHLAVRNNKQDEVRDMLMREPTVVNERGQQGLSPLMVAAHVNHHQIAAMLLSHGALPTYRDWDGRTAVHIAAKLGYADTLSVLLEDERVESKLYHPGTGRFSTNSALWMAALSHRGEYDKCMRMLVQHSKEHRWPGPSAASLLDQRDVEDNHTLLETCVSLSLTDVIPVVLILGATLDLPHPTLCTTPLCLAAQQTELESLTTLIQLGAQPNWRDFKSGNSALHHASSLQVASFLAAHGARLSLRNRDGTRITDIYAQSREVQTLMAAEQLYQQRKPVDTRSPIKPRPRSASSNGGHALDSCYLCGDGVGGLSKVVMMKKVGWCARCGYVMCDGCLSQELIFVDEEGEAVMAACSGCYNIEMYAEETADRRKRRQERQRKEAEEAKQSMSIFNLDYLTAALTAVHISQRALPGNVVSTYHGKVQIAELPTATSASPVSAPVAPVDPLAAPVASRRSPQLSGASAAPALRKQPSMVGPGANAALASVDRHVNYVAGGTATPRGGRKPDRLSVNELQQPADDSGSGGRRATGGLKESVSMDRVSDRMKKGNRSAATAAATSSAASTAATATRGKGRTVLSAQAEASGSDDGVADARTAVSLVPADDDAEPDDGSTRAKGMAAAARMQRGPRGGGAGKEERKQQPQQRQSSGEEEQDEPRVVERKGAERATRAGKSVLEVRVDDDEKRSKRSELVKKASKRHVTDDFT